MSVDFRKLALEVAAQSKCKKRKVGAVVVDSIDNVYAIGYNLHPEGKPCEDEQSQTFKEVKHAEIVAIENFPKLHPIFTPDTIYVTHQPCANCLAAIKKAGIANIHVVEEFMKFDTDKLRYDLIPPSSTKALAQVLTYGAKKYKANNYRNGDIARFTGALYRHLEAWRSGEVLDSESSYSHLAHALTNIAIIIELERLGGKNDMHCM